MRQPGRRINLGERLATDRIDADKKLFDRAEDDRSLRAPAMRVAVLDFFLSGERALLLQEGDDVIVCVEDVFADEVRQAALLGEVTAIIHRRKQREVVLAAEAVVVFAVAGRDMHASGAGIQSHKISAVNRCRPVEERMLRQVADQLGAGKRLFHGQLFCPGRRTKCVHKSLGKNKRALAAVQVEPDCRIGVGGGDGDRKVRGEGPRGRGPDDNRRLLAKFSAHKRKHDVDRRRGFILVFDLSLGQRGLRSRAPEDGLLLTVDQPGLNKSRKRTDDVGLVVRVQRQVRVLPVAQNAQPAELALLDRNKFPRIFFRAAAYLGRGQACGGFHHAEFDREPVAIPTGYERSTKPGHRPGFDDKVLENLVERCAHVDVAVRKRRAVMQHVEGRILAGFLNFFVKALLLPLLEHRWLALGQPGLHGKFSLRQLDRVFVSAHGKRQPLSASLQTVKRSPLLICWEMSHRPLFF